MNRRRSATCSRHDVSAVASAGIAELVGHLICQAELGGTRAETRAFADHMPWLTGAQRDEVVRMYTDARIDISRTVLERIAGRGHELRTQYTARYEQLR